MVNIGVRGDGQLVARPGGIWAREVAFALKTAPIHLLFGSDEVQDVSALDARLITRSMCQ